MAYAADQAKGRLVVVVVEGKTYQGLIKGANVVFGDNTHLHYFVVSQGRVLLVEEEIQSGSLAEQLQARQATGDALRRSNLGSGAPPSSVGHNE